MASVIVWYDKHGESFWPCGNDEEWVKSSWAILDIKLTAGHYYLDDDPDLEEVKRVVREKDDSFVTYRSGRKEPLAWKLVEDRSDYEYERITLEHLQEV